MNISIQLGRLCYEPELFESDGGVTYLHNVIAIRATKDKTDFIPFTAFDKTAELIANYVQKGEMVGLTGRLQSDKYEDKSQLKLIAFSVDLIPKAAATVDNPGDEEDEEDEEEDYDEDEYDEDDE